MDPAVSALLEITRGKIVESRHYGAIAIVNAQGELLYACGDPRTTAFMRSSAKPFQALPFFERGGPQHFGFDLKEQAIQCASHEGSDEHVRTVESMQRKAGIKESDLKCGVHMPGDAAAYKALIASAERPTPNRNNCSGKHTGMLVFAKMIGAPLDSYLERDHPVQQEILSTIAEMCDYPREKVEVGTDGCSAPNFAVPLYNAALAFARLCDPSGLSAGRAQAARQITEAMTTHPEMVSGYGEFDCRLMQTAKGQIVCKRGAEGFQGIGIKAGALRAESQGIGIAFKVSDGDLTFRTLEIEPRNRVRPAVTLEILRQIGALAMGQLGELSEFGPALPSLNHRGIVVGKLAPVFELTKGG